MVVIAANGQLVGVSARTGELCWRNEIEQGTVELAIARGLVVAAVGQFLYCCEYRSGRPLWRAETSFHARRASMVVEGELVYAFGNGTLDCFDGRGQRLWSRVLSPGLDVRAAIGLPGNISQADQG